jgi:hypothetical protein
LREGEEGFTIGVVLGGAGTLGRKNLLIRAAGPSLAQFGVSNPLTDPGLIMFSGLQQTAENNDWEGAGDIAAAIVQVGAFPFLSAASKDAAILAALDPGSNLIRVSANGSPAGTVLAEVYDATSQALLRSDTPRLANLSVLKPVGNGLTAGFVIGGNSNLKVLVRAIGPSLAMFGVTNFSAAPNLKLSRENGVLIAANAGWSGAPEVSSAMATVGAFPLSVTSKDAALLAVLSPGSYIAEISGGGESGRTALLEIYEVP